MSTNRVHEADDQLDVICELTEELGRARLPFWLIGGWAVDFHLGRISRSHSDVDLAVPHADREAFGRVVASRGFMPVPIDGSGAVEVFERSTVRVEATYLAVAQDARLYTPGFEHWPYPEHAFGVGRTGFRGAVVPVMSVAGLLDAKQGWHTEIGEPPRPHDLADIVALQALVRTEHATDGDLRSRGRTRDPRGLPTASSPAPTTTPSAKAERSRGTPLTLASQVI